MAAHVLVLSQIQLPAVPVCFCWRPSFANHAPALLVLVLPLCALLLLLLLLLLPAFIHLRTCSAERIQVLNRSSARGSVRHGVTPAGQQQERAIGISRQLAVCAQATTSLQPQTQRRHPLLVSSLHHTLLYCCAAAAIIVMS
jgi:hypothetical protein